MKVLLFSPRRLTEAREGAKLTQSKLARRMDTREQNVTRWESGLNVPNANAVAAMAQATGRDIEFFYTEADPDADAEEAAMRSRARKILDALDTDLQAALMGELYARTGAKA